MFPLYASLSKDIKNTPLSTYKTNMFLKTVKTLDSHSMELVFTLIYCHYKESNMSGYLPYGAKYTSASDITFDFRKFPNDLKHILFKFVKMNKNKTNL